MNIETAIKDKALHLISYLSELATIRAKAVRDIDKYERVLWISEIPQESECYTKAWGANEEFESDIWIEIKKRTEPRLGSLPEKCKDWVDFKTLRDSGLFNKGDWPELLSSIDIQVDEKNPDADPDDPEENQIISVTKTLKLEDHPEVSRDWESFIEKKWLSWAESHLKWKTIQNVYATLFTMYQEQEKLGEQYELVLGLGFLVWQTPTGHTIRRHLITAKGELTFEAQLGKFTVKSLAEGANLSVEIDMLEPEDQPPNIKTYQETVKSADDDPWDRSTTEPVLKSLANLVADQGQGEYFENIEVATQQATSKPIVYYAPALILRKRNVKALIDVLGEIKRLLGGGCKIPNEFINICEGKLGNGSESEPREFGETNHENRDGPHFLYSFAAYLRWIPVVNFMPPQTPSKSHYTLHSA